MRMRVAIARLTVRRPARVGNPGRVRLEAQHLFDHARRFPERQAAGSRQVADPSLERFRI